MLRGSRGRESRTVVQYAVTGLDLAASPSGSTWMETFFAESHDDRRVVRERWVVYQAASLYQAIGVLP